MILSSFSRIDVNFCSGPFDDSLVGWHETWF